MTMDSHSHRVLSGMRPTGRLHLGHYHGCLKNWIELQHQYECFFCVVDIHALTTHYEHPENIRQDSIEMVIDWLAVGINPMHSAIFLQSQVPEHAELHLLLSMITPLSWLERVPTYKEQQEKLKDRDLSTYGFLGYPLLQAADILIYNAHKVPVGEDQVPHVELAREVARRFNYLYGREPGFESKAEAAIAKMGKKNAKLYRQLLKRFQEQGEQEALATARTLLEQQQNISIGDKARLYGYLEGGGRMILTEPQSLLTPNARLPGIDGQKMSKSYQNSISLRESEEDIEKKIKTMPTDPARIRRHDAGNPEVCPVWPLHQAYSDEQTKDWVQQGCRSAGIGCLDCKKPLIEKIQAEVEPIRARAEYYAQDVGAVKTVLIEGREKARVITRETLATVRDAMKLGYD